MPDLPRLLRQLVSGVLLLQPDITVDGDSIAIPAGRGGELRLTSRTGEEQTFGADELGVIRAPRRVVSHAREASLCRVRRGKLRCRRVDLGGI